MRTISSMLNSVQKLDLPFLIETSMQETSPEIINLQQKQMLQGLNSDGAKIGKYRSDAYARKKASMNGEAGFGNVDLKLSGSFYADMFVDVRSEEFVIDSGDSKSGDLQNKYGEKIFGLDDKSKGTYIEEVQPVLQQKIIDKLNSK